MGVPIGDVARVSQVLLAQLQQSRDVSGGRTLPGVLTQDTVNTTQVHSSGNVESIGGFFKGDAGFLSNVVVGLQRVTDVGNITDNTVINTNKTRSCLHYSPSITNGIVLPKYVAFPNETDYNLNGYTAISVDSTGTTIVLMYSTYFRTLRIDPDDKRIILSSFDTYTEPFNPFAGRIKIDPSGTRLCASRRMGLDSANATILFYTRGTNTSGSWELSGTVYDDSQETPAGLRGIGFGSDWDTNDDMTVLAVGCPRYSDWTIQNYYPDVGMVKIYNINNGFGFVRDIIPPTESHTFFGSSVGVSRDGSKLIIYRNQNTQKTDIYDISGNYISTIPYRSEYSMKISNDGTVAVISNFLHKYLDSSWDLNILSGVIDITTSNATFKPSGNDIIKYEYDSGSTWRSIAAYSHLNGDIIHISGNGSEIITSVDGNLAIVDILDGEPLSMSVDINASKYYGDGGTLSNIVVGNDIFMSSVNYNSANVYGSNTMNLHATDMVATPISTTLLATNSTGTRVVFTQSRSTILPYIYDYVGTNWVNTTQLTSSLYTGSGIWDLDMSGDGQTITMVDDFNLYVWKYNGSIWVETRYDTGGEGTYYCKVSGDGNVVLACNQSNGGLYDGQVYSFINGTYTGTFKPSSTLNNDRLTLVKMNYDGTKVMLYDNDYTGANQGNARIYIFTRNGTSWSQEHQFNVSTGVLLGHIDVNQDFTVFSYSLGFTTFGPLYIYEYKDNTWTLNPYVGPSGLAVRSINNSGTQILAASYPAVSRYIIYNNNGNWEHKSVSSADGLGTRSIKSVGASTFISGLTGSFFEVADVTLDTTLNINATDVNISGTLTKASGTFKIDHPLSNMRSTHTLTHAFIEGPRADLIYRGKVQLTDGSAFVNIDESAWMSEGTFDALVRDVQCFVSNDTDWDNVKGFIEGNALTIHSQNTESNAIVSWLLIGERKDDHMYTLDWTNEDGRVVPEKVKM